MADILCMEEVPPGADVSLEDSTENQGTIPYLFVVYESRSYYEIERKLDIEI